MKKIYNKPSLVLENISDTIMYEQDNVLSQVEVTDSSYAAGHNFITFSSRPGNGNVLYSIDYSDFTK